ncbi:MAG: hypothetical protein ACK5AZ_22460 [Bryobacteraceae bacterium]
MRPQAAAAEAVTLAGFFRAESLSAKLSNACLLTVQEIYAAFGRGDVAAMLGHMAGTVEWEYGVNSTAVPWLSPRRGRPDVSEFYAAF